MAKVIVPDGRNHHAPIPVPSPYFVSGTTVTKGKLSACGPMTVTSARIRVDGDVTVQCPPRLGASTDSQVAFAPIGLLQLVPLGVRTVPVRPCHTTVTVIGWLLTLVTRQ